MTDQLREAASQMGWDPAFPIPGTVYPGGNVDWPQLGLTKREEFAGRALVALIPASLRSSEGASYVWAARKAVLYADALLAALARKE